MANTDPDIDTRSGRNLEGTNVYEQDRMAAEVMFAGSTAEAVVGAAAVVLAIIGLANVFPGYMACIATIVVGAALFLEGVAVAAEYRKLARRIGKAELGMGLSSEIVGGAAGIVLGILALLNMRPALLSPIAVIVFGAALLLSAVATARFRLLSGPHMSERARTITREAVEVASGAEVLIGIGAIVLGILALLGWAPRTLVLVSLLGLGASILFTGSAISSGLVGIFKR